MKNYNTKIKKMKNNLNIKNNRWINKINKRYISSYINWIDLFYLLLLAVILLIVSWQLNVIFVEHLCDGGSGSESVQDFFIHSNINDTSQPKNSSHDYNPTSNYYFAPNRIITSLKRPTISKARLAYLKKDCYITKYKKFFKEFTITYRKSIKLSNYELEKLNIKVAKAFNYDKYDISKAHNALPDDIKPLFKEFLRKKFC